MGGEISWISKVKGESHPKLEVSVAVNKVTSRKFFEGVQNVKFCEKSSFYAPSEGALQTTDFF